MIIWPELRLKSYESKGTPTPAMPHLQRKLGLKFRGILNHHCPLIRPATKTLVQGGVWPWEFPPWISSRTPCPWLHVSPWEMVRQSVPKLWGWGWRRLGLGGNTETFETINIYIYIYPYIYIYTQIYMYGTKNPIEMNIDMFFDRTGVALAIVPWILWDIMTAQTKPSPTDSAGFSLSFFFQLCDWTGGNGQEPGAVRPDCLRRLGLGCLSSGLATGFWSWLLRLDETNRDTVRSVPSGKPGKLTWQWQMDPFKLYFLLKVGICQPAILVYQLYRRVPLVCYVSIGRNCQDPGFALSILPQEAERLNSATWSCRGSGCQLQR